MLAEELRPVQLLGTLAWSEVRLTARGWAPRIQGQGILGHLSWEFLQLYEAGDLGLPGVGILSLGCCSRPSQLGCSEGLRPPFPRALSMASTCSLPPRSRANILFWVPATTSHIPSVCAAFVDTDRVFLACVCELFPMRLSFLCGQKVSACHRLATSLSPQLESRLPPQL